MVCMLPLCDPSKAYLFYCHHVSDMLLTNSLIIYTWAFFNVDPQAIGTVHHGISLSAHGKQYPIFKDLLDLVGSCF